MKTKSLFRGLGAMALLTASLTACQQGAQDGYLSTYTLDDFSVKEISQDKGTVISPKEMYISSCSKACLIYDSILAILDNRKTDYAVWLFNVKSQAYAQTLTIGNGPTEVNELRNLWQTGNTLHACDKTGKVLTIEVNPADLSTNVSKEAKLDVNLFALCTMSDGSYLTCGTKDRYRIVDCRDSLLGKVGVFPVNEVPSGQAIVNDFFMVEMKASPDRNHIVCANHRWNKIEIYDGKGNLERWLSGPIDVTSDIVMHMIPNTQIGYILFEPDYTFFLHAQALDNGFMVSYDDTESVPGSDKKPVGYYDILTFDWNGKPQTRYHFEQPFWTFAYDDNSHTMYMVIETDGEYQIIQYSGL